MPLSSADDPTAATVVEIGGVDVTDQVADASGLPKAKKTAKVEEPPRLARASSSGSADVHHLLAEREIALSNQDVAHVARVDEALAALGFEV